MKRGSFWTASAFVITVVASVFSARPAGPQGSELRGQTPSKPLQYEVSVVLKLIRVYVTDKKDNPVPDLAIGDFAITDNGQAVTITDFETRVLKVAAATPLATEPVESPMEKVATDPPAVRDMNRKFFLYIDFAYNNVRGVTKAKEAALHF
ncbi:MAG: hypothetical protein IH583_06020, partial [Candidatus Aminicenantes bacterium]|nr:hypothetical protein [Candidatus Aminicenantes bacterium]